MQKSTPSQEVFDAIVVGSGATGGWAAKQLTEAGWRVAMLEAGRRISPREFSEHKPSYAMEYLGKSPLVAKLHPIQISTPACTESNHQWFVNDFERTGRLTLVTNAVAAHVLMKDGKAAGVGLYRFGQPRTASSSW